MSYGNADDAKRDAGWESIIRDPFIRSCVRGLQVWLRSLDRDEISLWRTDSHYNVSFASGRRPKAIYWYFHGGKTGDGYFIHFELPKAKPSEVSKLKSRLSRQGEQPYNRKPRKDDLFTFNVFSEADLALAKEVIVERFNDRARAQGRLDRVIETRSELTLPTREILDASDGGAAANTTEVTDPIDLAQMAPAVEVATNDAIRNHASGQGFRNTPEARKAIEDLAMTRAATYFQVRGWEVNDVSANHSYDLRCYRAGWQDLHVEVKGTASDGEFIILTTNEVEHARK